MTKILIADDEPNILLLTEMLFKEMGLDVITAENGAIALEKLESESPDIVVTDILMPEKNGFEVCKEIRAHEKYNQVPVILLSALGDDFNKITGLEGGADDYITKPFNVEELKARVNALLMRYKSRVSNRTVNEEKELKTISDKVEIQQISTGIPGLDDALYGGFPVGSNILVLGELGSGKSSYARQFLADGLSATEPTLFICLDDSPAQIKQSLAINHQVDISKSENERLCRFIDAYSWNSLSPDEAEPFRVSGKMDLNQLSGLIVDAGADIGHSVQQKKGGRRVIDSISSLFVQFDLPDVQQFINQVARTAQSFGGVTTLFLLEKNTIDPNQLNNITYIMDGVIELESQEDSRRARVRSMKWVKYKKTWVSLKT